MTPMVAHNLIDDWLKQLTGRFVRLDTFIDEMASWLASRGLEEVGRVQCMVVGDSLPATGSAYRYALASH